jgi:hypothetical protein
MAETVKTPLRMGSNIEFLASARASEAIRESGHGEVARRCLLLEVKRTFLQLTSTSAYDPKRT